MRIRAIAKMRDRSLNSTPNSIETHKSYFARVMREMARSSQINGIRECKPPQDSDVVITWMSKPKSRFILWFAPMNARKALKRV